MTEREIEKKLKMAVENETPNVLNNVLSQCEEKTQAERRVIVMKNNKKFVKRFIAIAAAFAIILGGAFIFGAINNSTDNTTESVITLDVNPSLEIKLNSKEKVLEVKPLNDDAKKVIGEMDFKNSSLDVTVNAIIGSMVRNGYINELANSILVSVDSNDSKKGAKLEKKLLSDIEKLLKSDKFSGAVISQVVEHDDDIDYKAEKYGITVGKARLIEKIVKANSLYEFEHLVGLSINELNLLIQTNQNIGKEVSSSGNASDGKYIGKDRAVEITLNHADITKDKTTGLKAELDFEHGQMVYEVEFNVGNTEYEYDIAAIDGSILNTEKEIDKPDIDDDDDEIPPQDNSFIGADAAKQKAFEHAGITADKAYDIDCELEKKNGVWVYQIDFKNGKYEYEYEINTESGKVLKSEKELID